MADSSRTIMTDAGFALETRIRAGQTKIEFTRASISTADHFKDADDALAKLTVLDDVQQDGQVTDVQVIDDTTVHVQVDVDQTKAPAEYEMRSAGLYAKDDDGVEVLYGVTVLQDPVYVHKDDDGSYLGFGIDTAVGRSASVTVKVNPANMVTQQAFETTMTNYYTKAEVDAKFVTNADFDAKLPKDIARTGQANTFTQKQTLAGGAVDGNGDSFATGKQVTAGDSDTLTEANAHSDSNLASAIKTEQTSRAQGDDTMLANAKKYADNGDGDTLTSAKTYTDGKVAPLAKDADVVKKSDNYGAENLVPYSAYPSQWDPWTINGSQPDVKYGTTTNSAYHSGKDNVFYITTNHVEEVYANSNVFSLQAGKIYSFQIKLIATSNVSSVDVFFLGDSARALRAGLSVNSGSFTTISGTFVNDNSTSGKFRIDNNGSTDGKDATLFFTEVKVAQETTPSPWSPAPTDKLDVQVTTNWQQQALFSKGDYKLLVVPSDSDFRTYVMSHLPNPGIYYIRDDTIASNGLTDVTLIAEGNGSYKMSAITSNSNFIFRTFTSTTDTGWFTAVNDKSGYGSENLIYNSSNLTSLNGWNVGGNTNNGAGISLGKHRFYHASKDNLILVSTSNKYSSGSESEVTASSLLFPVNSGDKMFYSLLCFAGANVYGADIYFIGRKTDGTISPLLLQSNAKFSPSYAELRYGFFTVPDGCTEGCMRIDNNGSVDGAKANVYFVEPQIKKQLIRSPYTVSPYDFMKSYDAVKDNHDGTITANGVTYAPVQSDPTSGNIAKVHNFVSGVKINGHLINIDPTNGLTIDGTPLINVVSDEATAKAKSANDKLHLWVTKE